MTPALRPLAFLLLCAIWGSTWLVIKVGYGGLGPFNVAAIRFLLAGALLLPLAWLAGAPLPRGRLAWVLVGFTGLVFFAAVYGFVYWGEQFLDSGLTAVLFAVMPLLTILVAHAALPHERASPRKLAGGIVSVGGVVVLFWNELTVDAMNVPAMLAILASAACAAVGTVAIKKHGGGLHPMALTAWAMLIGGALLGVASLAAGDGFGFPVDRGTWVAVVYLAVLGSIVTFVLYTWLLATWEATTMSYLAILTPLVALLLGFVVLRETLTVESGLGSALVLCGVWMALTSRRVRDAEPVSAA